MAHEMSTAAGSLFSFFAISTTVGSSTTLWVPDKYAALAIDSSLLRDLPREVVDVVSKWTVSHWEDILNCF